MGIQGNAIKVVNDFEDITVKEALELFASPKDWQDKAKQLKDDIEKFNKAKADYDKSEAMVASMQEQIKFERTEAAATIDRAEKILADKTEQLAQRTAADTEKLNQLKADAVSEQGKADDLMSQAANRGAGLESKERALVAERAQFEDTMQKAHDELAASREDIKDEMRKAKAMTIEAEGKLAKLKDLLS